MSWSEELKEFEHAAWTASVGDPEEYRRGLEDAAEDSDELEEALNDLQKDIEEALRNEDIGDDEEDDMSIYDWLCSYFPIQSYIKDDVY